jgi:F-type H+-transporting ATPase subunit epsilon
MRITVISPEASVYDGEADAVTIPGFDGSLGVLPRHAPLMSLLGDGLLTIRRGDATERYRVRGGFVQVVHDTVRVVTEHVQGEPNA